MEDEAEGGRERKNLLSSPKIRRLEKRGVVRYWISLRFPFFSHENGLRENLYKVFFLPISPVAFCLEFSVGSIPKIRALGPAALLLSSARKKRLLEPSS